MTPRGLAAALVAVLTTTPTVAQELRPDPASSDHGRSRLEVGGQVGVIEVYPGAAVLFLGGPRLTVNFTASDALEAVAEAAGPLEDSGLHGLYGLQYKRRLGARVAARRAWFVTAGVLGALRYLRQPEGREQRPDGSTVVWPGYTSFTVRPPMIGTIGVGVERHMKRHLGVRADMQAFASSGGVGIRAGVGLSIPLGGADASRP